MSANRLIAVVTIKVCISLVYLFFVYAIVFEIITIGIMHENYFWQTFTISFIMIVLLVSTAKYTAERIGRFSDEFVLGIGEIASALVMLLFVGTCVIYIAIESSYIVLIFAPSWVLGSLSIFGVLGSMLIISVLKKFQLWVQRTFDSNVLGFLLN